ncbi:unnamed protein product [Adineta ricciae]|uniref:Uncharacterized protein n=1 Tax=Adineta ricciae TaxID=249248 RepID=A0A815AF66_ADIRI|nr:unnamed protein product [Adineta ricciae]
MRFANLTLHNPTYWRIRRSIRRFGRSVRQTLRPLCVRANHEVDHRREPLLRPPSSNKKAINKQISEQHVAIAAVITTFCTTENLVSRTSQCNQTMAFFEEDLNRWIDKSNEDKKQTLSLENGQINCPMIKDFQGRVKNAFVATVLKAYCEHCPLELSVEDFWVVIAQGVSIHLHENSGKCREFGVSHEGKKTLVLSVDQLRFPESERPAGRNESVPAINWPAAVSEICQMIKEDMEMDLSTVITKRFSSTIKIEGTVFDCSSTCGIPQIILRGSPADFQDLIDRVQQLKIILTDFHWWFNALLPNLEKLKESAEGTPDIDWWQRICHHDKNRSGASILLGWLTTFIPYTINNDGQHIRACREGHDEKLVIIYGMNLSDLEESITQTDFFLNNNGTSISMKFIAGFFGVGKNPTTSALRPCLGWVTAVSSEQVVEKFYCVKFKNETPIVEVTRILEIIKKEGGKIEHQSDFGSDRMFYVSLFDKTVAWLKQNEHIEEITLD